MSSVSVKVDKIRSYQTLVYKNGNRAFRKKEYKAYIQEIGLQLGKLKAVKGAYSLRVIFLSKTGTIGDLDNIAKPINDILQEYGKVENDRLCQTLYLEKIINKELKENRIIIELGERGTNGKT